MTTQAMYGVFNTETKELLKGPFKSRNGASTSRAATIDSMLLSKYLHDNSLDYHLYMTWSTNPKFKKNPHSMVGNSGSIQSGGITIPSGNASRFTTSQVDELIKNIDYFHDIIQIKECKVSYEE